MVTALPAFERYQVVLCEAPPSTTPWVGVVKTVKYSRVSGWLYEVAGEGNATWVVSEGFLKETEETHVERERSEARDRHPAGGSSDVELDVIPAHRYRRGRAEQT